jgi:hypothetical protein
MARKRAREREGDRQSEGEEERVSGHIRTYDTDAVKKAVPSAMNVCVCVCVCVCRPHTLTCR